MPGKTNKIGELDLSTLLGIWKWTLKGFSESGSYEVNSKLPEFTSKIFVEDELSLSSSGVLHVTKKSWQKRAAKRIFFTALI